MTLSYAIDKQIRLEIEPRQHHANQNTQDRG